MSELLFRQELNARNGMVFLATVLNETALDELEEMGIGLRQQTQGERLEFTNPKDPVEVALRNIKFVEVLKAAQGAHAGNT